MAPKRPRGEETRRQILDTSKTLILAKGFTATSMRDIADAAEITPGAIYNHFKNKDELFDALLEESFSTEEILTDIQHAARGDPREYIRVAVRSIVGALLTREDYIRLGIIDAMERQGRSIRQIPPKLFPTFYGTYRGMSEAEGGKVLRGLPPEAVLRTLISMVFGYVITEYAVRPSEILPLPDIDWVESMVDIFMYGIAKPREVTG